MARRFLRFGGRKGRGRGPKSTREADALTTFLGALSWKYVTEDAKFEDYEYRADDPDKLKEDLAHWTGRIWMHHNEVPTGAELESFEILDLEPEFRRYLDKHGGSVFDDGLTLEELWVAQQLYSKEPMVLFLSDRFAGEATDQITDKQILESEILVWLIAGICFKCGIDMSLNVLTSNGRMGHTIYIRGLNGVDFLHPREDTNIKRGWFSFHDPWPARSPLADRSAFPDIRVFEDITGPPLWLISPSDLEKVVVGFLIPSTVLSSLSDLVFAVKTLRRMRPDPKVPLWIESWVNSDQLFFSLFQLNGGNSPTAFHNLVGLAQAHLLIDDVSGAQALLQNAYALNPTGESKALFAEILRKCGHNEIAQEWRE
jgi:hypothetical protein